MPRPKFVIPGMTFPVKTRKLVKTHEPTVRRRGNTDRMELQAGTPQTTPSVTRALFSTLRTAVLGGMPKCSVTLPVEERKVTADVGRRTGERGTEPGTGVDPETRHAPLMLLRQTMKPRFHRLTPCKEVPR